MQPQITNEELKAFVEDLAERNPDAFMSNLATLKEIRLWVVEGFKQAIDPEYKPQHAKAIFAGIRCGESQRDSIEREYVTYWKE